MVLDPLSDGPAFPSGDGPMISACSSVRVQLSAGRMLALTSTLGRAEGVIALDAEAIEVRPFSAAAVAIRAWFKEDARQYPKRTRYWTPW